MVTLITVVKIRTLDGNNKCVKNFPLANRCRATI
jgi:hypothetical protein